MATRLLFLAAVLVPAFAGLTFAAVTDRHTNNGSYIFSVKPTPSVPVVGSNFLTLTIRDGSSGAAVEGATVKVVPWMTMHGHGSQKEAGVKEKGKGVYEVDNVYYSMEGSWDLLITIRKGDVEDSASVVVDVK